MAFPLEMASVRARSHSDCFNSLRLLASVRPRSHSGRGGGVRACPLAFWARELSEVPSARARSLYGRRGDVRASPTAFCAREPVSASGCQQFLISRQSSFSNSTPLLQDAKEYLVTLGRIGGSPSSTNVMCLGVRGRDRWDWEGTKYHRKNKFPPQGGGGN